MKSKVIGYPLPIRVTKHNVKLFNSLSPAQRKAVFTRDQMLCSRLGLSFDDYMSLIT